MNNKISQCDAQHTMKLANEIKASKRRRAALERYSGVIIALLIGSMFAIYALPNPNDYIVFPILGMAFFSGTIRMKSGARDRSLPQKPRDKWKLILFGVLLFAMFFITVFIRRTYDLTWLPVFVGSSVAIVIFLLSEQERRTYSAKADKSVDE